MLAQLRAQDELLLGLYRELLTLDEEVQGSISGFVTGFGAMVGEAGQMGKGCRVTIAKCMAGEQ